MTKPKTVKPVKAWAGVCEGKIHGWTSMAQPYYEIYMRRTDARKHYELAIPVLISPIKPRKRRSR